MLPPGPAVEEAELRSIAYTRHAREQLVGRRIEPAWVERVARGPLWTEPDPDHADVERRFGVVPEFGGRVLRVALHEAGAHMVVVTAMFDRTAWRRLRRGERP
jgi:hypothetical protein